MINITFIGAGNVTFRLSLALQQYGYNIQAVINRTEESAETVVRALKRHKSDAIASSSYYDIPADCNLIILSVSDSAICSTAKEINRSLDERGLKIPIVHTCGAVSLADLHNAAERCECGVLYPLMTLSKNKDLDIRMVPFLIEATDESLLDQLCNIVTSLRAEYKICSSEKRLQMHVAAVFISNFTNYMMGLAYEIAYPDFVFLLPCAIESVRKGFLNTPAVSQTGPAKRGDNETIKNHLAVLEHMNLKEQAEVYEFLSRHIMSSKALNQINKKENE